MLRIIKNIKTNFNKKIIQLKYINIKKEILLEIYVMNKNRYTYYE